MLNDKTEWAVVVTHPQAEVTVANHFDDADPKIEYYLPMMPNKGKRYRNRKVEAIPMFQCYIFVHINKKQVYQVRTTTGVVCFITFEHSISTLRDSEIEAIRRFEATQRKFEIKETNKLTKGAKVIIKSGEFQGIEGTMVKGEKDGNFAVSLSIGNISFVVHIKRDELKPALTEDEVEKKEIEDEKNKYGKAKADKEKLEATNQKKVEDFRRSEKLKASRKKYKSL